MAISYVGSASNSATTTSFDIDLSTIGLQQNDLVIILLGMVETADYNLAITTAGYTEVADLYGNDSKDCNFGVFYKFMGASPDTSVTCNTVSVNGNARVGLAYCFRGVDTSTPLDVTSTTAVGTNTGNPDNPSITPTTAGSVVLALGCGLMVDDATIVAPTTPEGFTNLASKKLPDSLNTGVAVAGASLAWTSGAVNPNSWSGFSTDTGSAWCAVSMALRVAPIVGPTNLKTYNTNLKANIKTINTNPIANVKSLNTNV